MSTYRLECLLAPRSIVIIAESESANGAISRIVENLHANGFSGKRAFVGSFAPAALDAFEKAATIKELSFTPDLAIIISSHDTLLRCVKEAGIKGISGAVILTEGVRRKETASSKENAGNGETSNCSLFDEIEDVARRYSLRLIGPNSIGIISPHACFNASLAGSPAQAGDLALITQSGALAAGVIEWAHQHGVGFSGVVSIGDQIDADFGDMLDYFALERNTRAILLYIESIKDARKFMSAARLAARAKPVVVIKSGRHKPHSFSVDTHSGALASPDAIYDAAFRRAGLLRVTDLNELFSAAETLGRVRPFLGKRLAIVTNGGGIASLAIDRLIDFGGALASLSSETCKALDAVLPEQWSHTNPVDLGPDADGARYVAALKHMLADRANDGILVLNVPLGPSSSIDVARAVIDSISCYSRQRPFPKPILTVWYGGDAQVNKLFDTARIPNYSNEGEAIRGFTHLVRYREALNELMETPPRLPVDFQPDTRAARAIVENALTAGRTWLDPTEVEQLFKAYQIPITPLRVAENVEEAVAAAIPFLTQEQSVAIKIFSPDIVRKSDIGGVRLNLSSESAVREAANDILNRAARLRPDARIRGLTVHPMMSRPGTREVIAGITDDPVFGPVIVFGRGGTAVEVINDKALALPPLDLRLAKDLIARTRVSRRLKAYCDIPAADERAVALTLVKLAQLAADLPEVREIDINPLLADYMGVMAVDGRVKLAPAAQRKGPPGHPRFAIRPYPQEWERRAALADGSPILLRPVRPEDEEIFRTFFTRVTLDDLRLRFFTPIKDFSHTFIARLTQLDYGRAMAFVAIDEITGDMLGAVRMHADANYETGEYGIMTRTDMRGKGLGWLLMMSIIEYAKSEGLKAIEGQVLRENAMMLAMCTQLGFISRPAPDDPDIRLVRLELT